MSVEKNNIKSPGKARRTRESILAEALLCRELGWKIGFISSGINAIPFNQLLSVVKEIKDITGEQQWLNVGILSYEQLRALKPYLAGINGAVETINPAVHDKVCPSKPVKDILGMFKHCDSLGIKKAITIIIGLGETIDDFSLLEDFIKKHGLDRITIYPLNPQKGTPFKKSPDKEYFIKWIAMTRIAFPKLKIISGIWADKTGFIPMILKAGANSITKFPSIKKFNSKEAKDFEKKVEESGRILKGTLTRLPEINKLNIEGCVLNKVEEYLGVMRRLKE
jgi:biotin synthase-like enzyme